MEKNLDIQGLTKKYPGFSLDNVSLYVPQGATVGLIGENGAGKSTLLKSVLGLLKPDKGSIEIFGEQDNDNCVNENIGVVFQKPKDELLYKYGLIKCTQEQFQPLDRNEMIAYRKQEYEYQVLVEDKMLFQNKHSDYMMSSVSIDEIMMLYIRGEVL